MTTTVTTSVFMEVGDEVLIGDEPMRVTESLGNGTYRLVALTRKELRMVRVILWWRDLRRRLHLPVRYRHGYGRVTRQ